MSHRVPGLAARWLLAAVLASTLTAVTGCSFGGSDDATPTPVPPTSAAADDATLDSQFTSDGTFQSHISVDGAKGLDFVYTLYPTKATPRTNEWYPKGKKYFTFTFQAYDLSQDLRAPFASKRKVYLDTVEVTSSTVTSNGGATQHPYKLSSVASRITFDPEAVTTRYGMLVTSPKGAFELRDQAIRSTSSDTIGVKLMFRAVVYIESSAGSTSYVKRTVKQTVPIEIFSSDQRTVAAKIPVDAS